MKHLTLLALGLCIAFTSVIAEAKQSKEDDSDVIYDEDKVPHYDLPDVLVTSQGKRVTTAEEWNTVRRPEIMSLFSNLIYGRIPEPESPLQVKYEVVKTDPEYMNRKGTRRDIKITFSNDKGEVDMLILVFTPNNVEGPVPVMMKHSFNSTHSKRDFEVRSRLSDRFRNGWPIGKWFDAGFGFVVVYQQDLVKHNDVEFSSGIHKLFYKTGQSFPKAHEWGNLSTVAWGAMRAMDYLETDDTIDHTRVGIMGHSKMGKAAIWTGAQDERFALTISAQSGCAGAALWRRTSGETLEKMVTRFPYWLSRNAWKFVGNEDDLPVDQHMLIACIAPRPVYIHSAVDDTWADGRGEYLSAYHASPVYELLGKKGLSSMDTPPLNSPIMDGDIGYHTREGGHTISDYDWDRFIEYSTKHLQK